MHQIMSLWSNGVDRVRSLRKISDATSWHKLVLQLHQFNPFRTEIRVVMKHCKCTQNYEMHQNMSLWSNWVDRCVRCEKFQCDFMPQTCALILPFQPTLHRVLCINERIQNAPKHYKMHQNMSLQSNGWIGFVRCQKFRCDFVARTFALIAPVQPVLHRDLCNNETIQNAPKYYKTHQYIS